MFPCKFHRPHRHRMCREIPGPAMPRPSLQRTGSDHPFRLTIHSNAAQPDHLGKARQSRNPVRCHAIAICLRNKTSTQSGSRRGKTQAHKNFLNARHKLRKGYQDHSPSLAELRHRIICIRQLNETNTSLPPPRYAGNGLPRAPARPGDSSHSRTENASRAATRKRTESAT